MKQSNRHVYAGFGFVLASIIVASVLYVGIRSGPTSNELPQAASAAHAANALSMAESAQSHADAGEDVSTTATPVAQSDISDQLQGGFSEQPAANGQCDGDTWSFSDNGTFSRLNGDTGVSNSGQWQVANDMLELTNIVWNDDQDRPTDGPDRATYAFTMGRGTIKIGSKTYFACAGG